jgi:hypothetical protein
MSSLENYQNIRKLFGKEKGDSFTKGEELLSKFREQNLETINQCLSVVNFDQEPTQDWIRDFNSENIDRANSAFAEILLLYHLREKFGSEKVEINAKITEKSDSKDFDLRLSLDEEVWIEVVKRDFSSNIPEDGGFISNQGTGKTIDNKLKDKFEEARNFLSEDKILILGVYLEEMTTQSLQIGKWLDEEYYDVSKFCDGIVTYTHLTETRFEFYPFTAKGEEALNKLKSKLGESPENISI